MASLFADHRRAAHDSVRHHKLRVALPKVNLRARPLPARLRDWLYDRVADVR
ncbi:hypothetical protein [Mycobacterium avium]|uniref:hypothetical protein n=1 Tax=Mycobacterium avium TaxID=1764 RepID=UPI000302CF28|nr:hypothetical protein [Mycobacterium avium]QPM72600.1 hypothetical protein MAPS_17490 [Mycobacterium avium subsp. paratuberculosis S397]WAI53232.1 hypothetical protein OUZ54_15375 [Mycobacterium avium subsp. paratuberculosis]WPS75373.1 hypothetical protein SLH60_15840 [Mycobacterium avium subsp. paratuberculosis]